MPSALERLKHQSVPFELAIMDGGSMDNFEEVVEKFSDMITYLRSAPDEGQAYAMNMEKMTFEDEFFDHGFSICVFEHLDFCAKQKAMVAIHRCLKPGGQLCLTFDYLNPAPYVFGYKQFDARFRNALNSPRRFKQIMCANGLFELQGNQEFYDRGKRYLQSPRQANIKGAEEYTFGALFLKKRAVF